MSSGRKPGPDGRSEHDEHHPSSSPDAPPPVPGDNASGGPPAYRPPPAVPTEESHEELDGSVEEEGADFQDRIPTAYETGPYSPSPPSPPGATLPSSGIQDSISTMGHGGDAAPTPPPRAGLDDPPTNPSSFSSPDQEEGGLSYEELDPDLLEEAESELIQVSGDPSGASERPTGGFTPPSPRQYSPSTPGAQPSTVAVDEHYEPVGGASTVEAGASPPPLSTPFESDDAPSLEELFTSASADPVGGAGAYGFDEDDEEGTDPGGGQPPFHDVVTTEGPPPDGGTSPFDLSTLSPDEQDASVAAPSFDQPIELIREEDIVQGESLATQLISSKLLTSVTSITSLAPPEEAAEERAAPPEEHRDVDPRPFLESLRRNPTDGASMSALRRVTAATRDWDGLVGQLLELAETFADSHQRFALLFEVARVFEEDLRSPERAQVVLISAFLYDPTSDEAASRLGEVTSRAGLWSTLFAELGQAVAAEGQAARRAGLCAWLGDWYLQAGHLAYAQPCYQQALQAEPRSLRAMAGMALIFEQTGDTANLDAALQYIPPALPPGTAADLCLRIAGLLERRGNPSAAAIALDQALGDHPDDDELIAALERVLGAQQRFGELAERLSRRAESLQKTGDDPKAAAELWRRVATLQADDVGDLRGAERAARAVIDLLGHDRECYDLLDQIYQSEGRWSDLLWVLEQKLEATQRPRERAELLIRLARLQADEFVQLEAAVERLEEVIVTEPRNLEAYQMLVDLHRNQQQWPELAGVLERAALAEREDQARFDRLVQAAEVRARELGESAEAVELLRRALKIITDRPDVMGRLAEVLLQTGDARGAYDTYREQAAASPDPSARAAALARAAEVAREHLMLADEAMSLLEQAIELDPSQSTAAAALRQQRMAAGDWDGAARALETEISQATGPAQRGKLLVQLGELLRDRLRRELDAIDAYERARIDLGDTAEVLRPLFDLYVEHEHLGEASALTEPLARALPRGDPEALAAELMRYAEVALKIKDEDKALKHLEAALAAAPAHPEALAAVSEIYERRERWADARRALSTLIEGKRRAGELIDVPLMARLGRCSRLSERPEDARRWFEAVLEQQPSHNEALRQLAAVAEERGNPLRAAELLEQVDVDDDNRFDHFSRLAQLAKSAGDDGRYERALRGALAAREDDHHSLTRLLELLSRQERWAEAVETIIALADTVKDKPKVRAKYFSAAAKIYRDKLNDLRTAATMCDRSLKEDWTNLGEFEVLDRMLTQAREYELQEQMYRKMIHRVTGKERPELEAQLWHALGEIHRSRLKQYDTAADAFTVASRLEPDNVERHQILAELYQALDRKPEAIERHKQLLRLHPGNLEALRAIRELCSATGQYDSAFAVVSHLAARGQASEAELEFFEQWLPKPMIHPSMTLGDEEWLRHLRHPDEDAYVSGIFDTILSVVLAARARPPKEYGLTPATAVDFNQQGSVLAQQFLGLVRLLGLRVMPQLHVVREHPSSLAYAITNPATSIMGGGITQVEERQRVFLIARHLAFYRGGRFMAILSPSKAELGSVLVSAVAAVTGQDQAVPPTATKFLQNLRSQLQRNPPLYERLSKVVRRFVARGGKADFDRWLRGVELTACRAGMLVVADPRVAGAALKIEQSSPAAVSAQDRFEDLLNFVVSDQYLALRKALGVAVG